jgi:hypothetical protein
MHRNERYGMADKVFFVQVIDTSSKSDRSSKLPQCRYLEPLIQNLLHGSGTNIQYDIFYGGVSQFEVDADQQQLIHHIRSAVTIG